MAYTEIDDPSAFFQIALWTGNGSNRSITFDGNSDMQPDWVWGKNRSNDDNDYLMDSVRGATKFLTSNNDTSEGTASTLLTSFNSDGFSLGTGSGLNASGVTAVGWCWKAGTSFSNDASATGIGTIDSSGSVNETAGFSIVSYTGTGSAATIKHGLSTTPNMMIIKNRVTSSKDWQVYSPVNDPTDALALNQTDATGDSDVYWNDTAPTSSVFSVKSGATNTSGAATIGYIFSNRQGYSKFGSYVGNGSSSGTYVHLGFKPAWLMVKRTDSSNAWIIHDNKRSPSNVVKLNLNANTINPENTNDGFFDFLSNGFKCRSTDGGVNASGGTYIYMAFAEAPFVNSNGVPCNAR